MVGLNVDLILARGTPATTAVQNATGTIPVVIRNDSSSHDDNGRPRCARTELRAADRQHHGGDYFQHRTDSARVQVLKELVPGLTRVALLHNMGNPAVPAEWDETKIAARLLGLAAELLDVRSEGDLSHAFELVVRRHIDGLVVGADGLTQMHQEMIVEWVARNRVPTVFPAREFVEAGGLIAYAVNYPDLYFQLAAFIDKIFNGAKPGDLPVQQPTKFELAINLRTASALGLEVPPTLLAQADKVIE